MKHKHTRRAAVCSIIAAAYKVGAFFALLLAVMSILGVLTGGDKQNLLFAIVMILAANQFIGMYWRAKECLRHILSEKVAEKRYYHEN